MPTSRHDEPIRRLMPLDEFLAKSGLDALDFLKLYLTCDAPGVAIVGDMLMVPAQQAADWLFSHEADALSVQVECCRDAGSLAREFAA